MQLQLRLESHVGAIVRNLTGSNEKQRKETSVKGKRLLWDETIETNNNKKEHAHKIS